MSKINIDKIIYTCDKCQKEGELGQDGVFKNGHVELMVRLNAVGYYGGLKDYDLCTDDCYGKLIEFISKAGE